MPEYRDIGSINNLSGPMQEVNTTHLTQVFQATHIGENYLPYMNRSFISFSYGGKNIEDFNLIATIDGDRMKRDGYASFNHLTSSYEVMHGLSYWGTYYKTNSLNLTLATDEMTQLLLDEFVYWFAADSVRELILAEHPNRAIIARISKAPSITMLPFEKKITIPLGGDTYQTSTTVYRGEISLSFEMDEPHWYAKRSIFGYLDNEGIYRDEWTDANGQTRRVFDDPDAIKIAIEDGIPFSTMIHDSMLLGDNTYANVDFTDHSRIATMTFNPSEANILNTWTEKYLEIVSEGGEEWWAIEEANYVVGEEDTRELYVKGAVIAADDAPSTPQTITIDSDLYFTGSELTVIVQYYNESADEFIDIEVVYRECIPAGSIITPALIAGPEMTLSEGIVSLSSNPEGAQFPENNSFIYYPGTAPSPVELSFVLTPSIADGYVNCPNNTYAISTGINAFNTITLEGELRLELRFTTCGFHTAYNKAMSIFKRLNTDYTSWVQVREDIRDQVRHKAVRAWANKIIDYFDPNGNDTGGTTPSNAMSNACTYLEYMLKDNEGHFLANLYTFNSKTGKATAKLHYRVPNDSAVTNWATYQGGASAALPREEDVGDMLRSNYLTIREHNILDANGNVSAWERNNKKLSHRIYHDVNNGLNNITLVFKNMYL